MTTHDASLVPHIGSVIAGKYLVERIVGQGGMGVVVAVKHLKLRESFALKLMIDDVHSVDSVERFLREARAAFKLKNNEHVASVTDVDTLPSGQPYMVMELLEGRDLDKLLRERGVLPFHEACTYVVQACNALAKAHELGIIHRDLKPQNLFLTHRKDGSPCIKVLDFGIAKHVLVDDSAGVDLTKQKDVLGSAYYMSPEQFRSSRDVIPQSDIWSLGVILYKLLAGRVPFPGKTTFEVFTALLEDRPVPPPSLIRTDLPPRLEAVILRCLEKKAAHRYASVRELMAALAPFTVPGETNAGDELDAATTIPIVRGPKVRVGNGTLPMTPVGSDNRGIGLKTQPLDARTLQAALHEYLPPRANPRPAPPSHPQLPNASEVSVEQPTPRIAAKEVPPAKPSPPTDTVDFSGTVYVPPLALAKTEEAPAPIVSPPNRLPSEKTTIVAAEWFKQPRNLIFAALILLLVTLGLILQRRSSVPAREVSPALAPSTNVSEPAATTITSSAPAPAIPSAGSAAPPVLPSATPLTPKPKTTGRKRTSPRPESGGVVDMYYRP